MRKKIKALLFDFTKDHLAAHEAGKVHMTSGENVLKDIMIQFENGECSDSPFVELIEIEPKAGSYDLIRNEQMSHIIGIDEHNLCFYPIYTRTFKKNRSFTRALLSKGARGEFMILANNEMFEGVNPVFEIRFKYYDNRAEQWKWSSWQAIAGKFIVAQTYKFGPGGIAEVYSSLTEKEIETFKQDFQIRYSGSSIVELGIENSLPRIMNDPFNGDFRKVIDPNTFQILFDSQIIQEVSSEKSYEIWKSFEERYT
ncbi:hypothetical protein [Alkalihalobacillus trypoxylicola]|uniref:Uncharacterized protein n=1 Tax=Alkalihalobacillus trypoxylicola TaxID=519424 RepID=A0A161PYR2_9BACI|nr:hypothetical protein [Alkalihalobacillus trypoxylicola]KYG27734.1 hypothetical protein AZF04_11135 [Alkalihalobacillus trypoxylicola]